VSMAMDGRIKPNASLFMPTVPLETTCPGVAENGDFLVFYVDSSRPGKPHHRVDIQKFCGNGHCDCEDFTLAKRTTWRGKQMTKKQALEAGAVPSPGLECRHIRAAKRFLCFRLINHMIEVRERTAHANQEAAKARSVVRSVPGATKTFSLGRPTPFAKRHRPDIPS